MRVGFLGDATPPSGCLPCQPFPFPAAPVMLSRRMKAKETTMSMKIVGKSGQISLGKALAGTGFLVEELPGGGIVLRRAAIVPVNER